MGVSLANQSPLQKWVQLYSKTRAYDDVIFTDKIKMISSCALGKTEVRYCMQNSVQLVMHLACIYKTCIILICCAVVASVKL